RPEHSRQPAQHRRRRAQCGGRAVAGLCAGRCRGDAAGADGPRASLGAADMGAMFRSYGRGLTALFIGMTVAWILLLILLPQLRLIERAFTFADRGGTAAELAIEIDRAYTRVFEIDMLLADLRSAAEGTSVPSSGAPSSAPPTAEVPSPSLAPSPVPSPAVPSLTPAAPSFPTPGAPTPGLPTPGLGGSSAVGGLSQEDAAARIVELTAEKTELQQRIVELE